MGNSEVLRLCALCARGPAGHARLVGAGDVDLGGTHGLLRIAICGACGCRWVRQNDEVVHWWLRAKLPDEKAR